MLNYRVYETLSLFKITWIEVLKCLPQLSLNIFVIVLERNVIIVLFLRRFVPGWTFIKCCTVQEQFYCFPWLKSCGLFLRVILVKKYVLLVSTGQTKKNLIFRIFVAMWKLYCLYYHQYRWMTSVILSSSCCSLLIYILRWNGLQCVLHLQ